MRGAWLRRLLHVASAAVLLLVPLGSLNLLRLCLLFGVVLGLLIDVLRKANPSIAHQLNKAIPVFRESERGRLSGATWLAMGYLLAALFPSPASTAGILVGATADPAASAVGTWKREAGRKTVRGSLAALSVSVAALFLLGVPVAAIAGGSVVAVVLERWSNPLNDNLVVAPAVALSVWLLSLT